MATSALLQAPLEAAVLYLQPREVYPDPFRAGTHVLVLCDAVAPPAVCDGCPPSLPLSWPVRPCRALPPETAPRERHGALQPQAL